MKVYIAYYDEYYMDDCHFVEDEIPTEIIGVFSTRGKAERAANDTLLKIGLYDVEDETFYVYDYKNDECCYRVGTTIPDGKMHDDWFYMFYVQEREIDDYDYEYADDILYEEENNDRASSMVNC